jgi:hypothetical protein
MTARPETTPGETPMPVRRAYVLAESRSHERAQRVHRVRFVAPSA